jgi:hypothetical protein
MRSARPAVRRRSAALATTVLCALICASTAAAGVNVDYTAAPTPRTFIDVRAYRDMLRLPPLLVEACSPRIPHDPVGTYGEDHMALLLGKVELLRILDSSGGPILVRNFMQRSTDAQYILDDYRFCLGDIAPDWDLGGVAAPGLHSAPTPKTKTGHGWDEVAAELGGVPTLSSAPGTKADLGPCRNGEGDWDMASAYLVRIWALAHDALQRRLSDPAFQSLKQKVADAAWLQGGPAPIDDVICPPIAVGETENHRLMIETTRLLHNEWIQSNLLPSAHVGAGGDWVRTYDSDPEIDNDKNGLNARLHNWFEGWATHDFLEYNARSYSRFQLLGLLNVYDFSAKAELRRAAGAVLDLLAAKAAAESMNVNRTAPFRRRAENQDRRLLASDQVAAAMQVWVGSMAPTAELDSFGFVHVMALAASTSYRPPDVLTDVMLDPRHHDYLQSFDGMGQGELAFGTRDFTLAGGGLPTRCPYPDPFTSLEQALVVMSAPVVTPATPIPGLSLVLGQNLGDECKGDGNDRGTVQRIVLLPRRPPRVHSDGIPMVDHVIHNDDNSFSDCIGVGIACSQAFVIGGPPSKCRDERQLPDGDTTLALRYDGDCVDGPDFAGLCYFVFIRTIETKTQPFSYLVTHLCDPAASNADRQMLFEKFISYLTDGDGQPTRPDTCDPRDRSLSPFPAADSECTYVIEVTPPEQYGPIRPAQRVVMLDEFDALYMIVSSPMWSQARSADGPLAKLLPGIPRLQFADPGAGEWVVDPVAGGAPIDSSESMRKFDWNVHVTKDGTVSGQIVAADHPEAFRRITVNVLDETKLQNDCTVTLPNGNKACYSPSLICDGRPCTTGSVAPVVLPSASYDYGTAPIASHSGIPFGGTLGSVDLKHTYVVTVCAYWYRFMTPEEYRVDPHGTAHADAHETCLNVDAHPQDCNPLLCDPAFNPITPHFPDFPEKRRGHFP